jgi:hypothetical protein
MPTIRIPTADNHYTEQDLAAMISQGVTTDSYPVLPSFSLLR